MSEQLSEHFSRAEFEGDGSMPEGGVVDAYRALCAQVLEPIRAHVNAPMEITSGYRNPQSNAAAHGVSRSQHMATAGFCAADFAVPGKVDLRDLFDWVRLESGLPFDQVILEHGEHCDVIHISWVKAYQRHEALEGATHNQSAYKRWPSVMNPKPESADA